MGGVSLDTDMDTAQHNNRSFKTWLEKNMGSAGIDQSPTNTASQSNAMVGNFFAKSPQGPKAMGSLTGAGNEPGQLKSVVPDIAANIVKFAGQDANRAQVTPFDMIPHIGNEMYGKDNLPTFFNQFSNMLKKMKKS